MPRRPGKGSLRVTFNTTLSELTLKDSHVICVTTLQNLHVTSGEMVSKADATACDLEILIECAQDLYLASLFPTYFDKTTPTTIFLTISWVSIRIQGPGCR